MSYPCCQTRIGPFVYDSLSGELTANGHTERLEPRTSQVLDVLLAHKGRVVLLVLLVCAVRMAQGEELVIPAQGGLRV